MALKINPDESTIIKFEVDVSGSKETPLPRLIIPISENGIGLIFEGKLDNGIVEVDVSELIKLTDSKTFSGKLEVVVEDSIFYPWEDTIQIKEVTKVKASAKKTKTSLKESKIKVSVKNQKSNNNTKKVMELKKKNLGDMFSEKL